MEGVSVVIPLSFSVFAYGVTFGTLSHGYHFKWLEAMLTSFCIYSGTVQFTMLNLLQQEASLWTIFISIHLIAYKYFLYGLTLSPALGRLPFKHMLWLSHGLVDESYSMSMLQVQEGKLRLGCFLGSSTFILLTWTLSTMIGNQLGQFITAPAQFGLDFAFTATLLGLLVCLLQTNKQIFIAGLAVIASIVGYNGFGINGALFAGATVAFIIGVYFE